MAITISTSTLDLSKGALGVLQASGGTAPYSWSIASGTLPAGLTFTSDGRIAGKAVTSGTASITVRATDSGTAAGAAPNDPMHLNAPDATGRQQADATVSLTF